MKKIISVFFAIAALMLPVLNCAAAEHADPKTGLHYEVHTDQDTGEDYACILSCKAEKDVLIPAEIDGLPVREIDGDFVWRSKGLAEKLTTLTIEGAIRVIGPNAFEQCKSLTTVKLPEGLEEIGASAFGDIMTLTSINFPRDKTKLEFPAEIAGVRITVIGDNGTVNAEGYEKVTSVVIPEGVTEIGKKAFYWFKELSSVKLPDTLKTIEAGILDGHGENLRVTCGEGSGMEKYLQENYPDVKIAYPGK